MYDVTITNVNTLEVTHKKMNDPLGVLTEIDWAEIRAQHEVEEQVDIHVCCGNGDKIYIKGRRCEDAQIT